MKKLCVAVVVVLLGCGGDSGVGPDETRLAGSSAALSVTEMAGVVGEDLANSVEILVRDSNGDPLPTFAVEWVVTAGGGSIIGGDRTDQDGVARAAWTLGTVAGEHALEARIAGLPAVTFTATAAPGAPAAIATNHEQVVFDLPTDSLLLTALISDEYGNELPTGEVEWTTSDGDVLSVDASGWIRATGGGSATITVTADTHSKAIPASVDLPSFTAPFIDLDLALDFMAFGEPLSADHDNVAYEIMMDDDSMEVASVTTGRVERVAYQEDTEDYEVFVQYSDSWLVLYDHVVDPRVDVGDDIAPGEVLGLVAYFGNRQVGMELVPMGRIELQVNYIGQRGPDWAWCPAIFGTPEFNAMHHEALLRTSNQPATCVKQTARP